MAAFKNSQIIESQRRMSEYMQKKHGSAANHFSIKVGGGDNESSYVSKHAIPNLNSSSFADTS
jgi:hypothetical protein